MTGLPDLSTGSPKVQRILGDYLDRLLDAGVSGFRVLGAGHIDQQDIRGILDQSKNKIRDDIRVQTGSTASSPTLIMDLWPSWLVRYPHLQPDYYPDELTPFQYYDIDRNNAVATDLAWSFKMSETFYGGSLFPGQHVSTLEELTSDSISTRFLHPLYKQKTDRIPLDGLILQVTNHFISSYGVWNCPNSSDGTVDVQGNFHEGVCPASLSAIWDARLLTLGTVWMMTLPVRFTRVYSSYDWVRHYKMNKFGHPFDLLYSAGPPRTADGETVDVRCELSPDADMTPLFKDDGTRWLCEHRKREISVMPKWRIEVAQAGAGDELALNEWVNDSLGRQPTPPRFVSISRSKRLGENKLIKGGWVAINAGNVAIRRHFLTRLPSGVYTNLAVQSEEQLVVNSYGILDVTLAPLESVIIHTGEALLEGPAVTVEAFILAFVAWVLLPIFACYITVRKLGSKSDVVKRSSASCALIEDGLPIGLSQAAPGLIEKELPSSMQKMTAMICTLEHSLPSTEHAQTVNQKCGGLGKVK